MDTKDLEYVIRLMMETIEHSSAKAVIRALEEQNINLSQDQKNSIYNDIQDSNSKFVKKWIIENPKE